MGTRSTTTILNDNREPILRLYKQFDGYIAGGLGETLIDLLKDRVVVNGYTMEDERNQNFNGMSCLAAQIVADLKEGIGGIYIQPLDDCYEGSFDYTISCIGNGKDGKPQKIHMVMKSYGDIVYDGLVDDYHRSKVVEH